MTRSTDIATIDGLLLATDDPITMHHGAGHTFRQLSVRYRIRMAMRAHRNARGHARLHNGNWQLHMLGKYIQYNTQRLRRADYVTRARP